MNKIKWLMVIFMITALFIPYQTVFASDDFGADISLTENNETGCYDIDIEVYNPGKNLNGKMELQIGSGGYSTSPTIYVASVSLPEKSTKRVSFSVPVISIKNNSFNVSIAIKDENNKVVYDKVFNTPLKTANSSFNVGILSNNPDALSSLDLGGQMVWITTGDFVIRHNVIKAPTLEKDIINQRAVIINDYDTSTLTQDEKDAIIKFVRDGGVLYLGTGKNMDSTKGFDQSFTGISGSVGLTKYYFTMSDGANIAVDAQQFDYASYSSSDASILYSNYGECGYLNRVGDGAVVTLAYNPADPMFQNMPKDDFENFVSSVYDMGISGTNFLMEKEDYEFDGVLNRFAEYMEEPARNTSAFLVPIVLIYIFLIGPGIYLILKKFDKREKCWIIIPCVALIFTFFIFLFSLSFSVKKMNMKSIVVQDVNSSKMIAVVSGYSPKADKWEVDFDENYYSGYLCDGWYGGNSKTRITNSASGVKLEYDPSGSFEEAEFVMYGKGEKSGEFTGIETIQSTGTAVVGNITNKTGSSFENVVIMYQDCYTVIGPLKDGESADLRSRELFSSPSGNGSTTLLKQIRSSYNNDEYEEASYLAALGVVMEGVVFRTGKNSTNVPIIIGVKKSDNIMNMKNGEETSYTCVFMD